MLVEPEFYEQYKEIPVPFGPLGYITYKRTYARYIESENRTEEWWETCRRVVEGNIQLEATFSFGNLEELIRDAKVMYDDMFHIRWLPGGRGLWCSGTDIGFKNGGSLTNCFFVELKPYNEKISTAFAFTMDMLMLGAGVGFSVREESISEFPQVRNPVNLHIVCSPDHRDYQFLNPESIPIGTKQEIRLFDSREGWVYGLKKIIDSAFLSKRGNSKTLVIDVSDVRPTGEPIKSFGGKSSGPAPLVELYREINRILNSRVGQKLTSVDCTDIMNLIGRCVVAGNVRRSAEIALGDINDINFSKMKKFDAAGLEHFKNSLKSSNLADIDPTELQRWQLEEEKAKIIQHHRWASNNSLVIDDKTNLDEINWQEIANSIITNGEPGIFNLTQVQHYARLGEFKNDPATGTNPCGEISLESFEPCNLAEIFPSRHRSFDETRRCLRHAYTYAKRVTLSNYNWPQTAEVVKRNRRIGVSISGFQDWLLQLGSLRVLVNRLESLYSEIKNLDRAYSNFLQIPESIKLTTVKPSGTISLLAGVSSGIHGHYSEYFIRRIQIQDTDPLIPYLQSLGFRTRPASQTPRTTIVEFPVWVNPNSNPNFKSESDRTAYEQLQFQRLIQTHWADNQVSATISFKQEEQAQLPDLLKEFSIELKSTSLLPYFDLGKEGGEEILKQYPDLPNQPIIKEQYEVMIKEIKEWPQRMIDTKKGLEILNQDECAGGHCPIK